MAAARAGRHAIHSVGHDRRAADRHDTHTTKADILLVYAPGSSPDHWPDGMAKFIPAGSDLVFQMHYTTHGRPTVDQTSVGIVFAKQPPHEARCSHCS